MFRFLIFIGGITLGFMTAIFVLPMPGRTFFNKMSKLPKNLKDIIDHGLGIAISLVKLGSGVYEDVNLRLKEAVEEAQSKIDELKSENQAEMHETENNKLLNNLKGNKK